MFFSEFKNRKISIHIQNKLRTHRPNPKETLIRCFTTIHEVDHVGSFTEDFNLNHKGIR